MKTKRMEGAKQIFINNNSKIGVLMLHGFSSTPGQFKGLVDYLSGKGFNISAPLIAGHGTSLEDFVKTSPKEWTKSAMDAYLKLKNISEKVFIIGNSFGANLGFWLTRELNNEPAGIVTLGAPIFLRFHNFIKFRLFTYYRFIKHYKKSPRMRKTKRTNAIDEFSYPALPVKNIKEFIIFLEKETMPSLPKIKIPILIVSASVDPVVHPKSAEYIFQKIGSSKKEIFLFDSAEHDIVGWESAGIFPKIYEFIKGVEKSKN